MASTLLFTLPDTTEIAMTGIPGTLNVAPDHDDRGGSVIPNARAGESQAGEMQVVVVAADDTGTAQAGAASTITLKASSNADDDYYNDNLVTIVSGLGAGQVRRISDYDGTTKIATVSVAWATAPDVTSVYVVGQGATFENLLALISPPGPGGTDITGDATSIDALVDVSFEGDAVQTATIRWKGTITPA